MLRGHVLRDFADCVELWSDPLVTRHIGGRPFSREEIWARLLRYAGHWALLGFGFWRVEEASSGRFVGDVGFADFQREMTPSFGDTPEMGWALAPWCHGRGMATEAVRTALTWGSQRFGPIRVGCMIEPDNASSLRVAEKCGFREFRRSFYRGAAIRLFDRTLD